MFVRSSVPPCSPAKVVAVEDPDVVAEATHPQRVHASGQAPVDAFDLEVRGALVVAAEQLGETEGAPEIGQAARLREFDGVVPSVLADVRCTVVVLGCQLPDDVRGVKHGCDQARHNVSSSCANSRYVQ